MNHLFIVGAQRSGSTYLFQVLDSHPQVSMVHPVRPEPKFFMSEELVSKGREYYEQTYFSDSKPDSLYLGEKSTSYIESTEAAVLIKHFYPNARILMILRDPVVRAYSNYRFSVAHKFEELTFGEALAAEHQRLQDVTLTTSVNPYAYRKRGHYINYIKSYLEVFDLIQLRVLIFEEVVNKLENVQSLYRWLGIDDNHVPGCLNEILNPGIKLNEDQQEAFRDLAFDYRDSISRLERFMGRKIDVWCEQHRRIFDGVLP